VRVLGEINGRLESDAFLADDRLATFDPGVFVAPLPDAVNGLNPHPTLRVWA